MAVCGICGVKLGLKKVMIKGGNYLCFDCVKKAGYNPLTWMGNMKTSLGEIQSQINGDVVQESRADMTVTRSVGNIFMMDENSRLWYSQDQFGLHKGTVHRFEDIIDYELLEDGNMQTKGGLGSAVAGGLAFGSVGALVGASVGKKTTTTDCTSMRIKITLNNLNSPVEYVNLLQMKVAKKSAAYKKAYEQAQEILSILNVMTAQKQNGTVGDAPTSAADEIVKFKKLMDDGVITPEEFEAKKKQLLGL